MSIFSSIRARFTGWYLFVLSILLIAMSIGVYAVMRHTLTSSLDRALAHRLEEVIFQPDFIEMITGNLPRAPLGEINGAYVLSEGGWTAVGYRLSDNTIPESVLESSAAGAAAYVTIDHEDGPQVRYLVSAWAPQPRPVSPPDPAGPEFSQPREAQPPLDIAFETAVLVVGRPTDDILSALHTLRNTLLLAIPLTLLLSGSGGLFLIRRALQPVDQIIATARAIEETDLAKRVPVQSRDELGRLTQTINSMLDRLEKAFARQRQFTDDASHELRTPLSVIEAEATLALMRERDSKEYREALATIAEESSSMHRLINQLLTLARGDSLDQENLEMTMMDLGSIVAEVAAALEPLAKERGVKLFSQTTALYIIGDPVRIRRLVVNLVDNAIRYTEQGGSVWASVAEEGAEAVLRVKDNGIGIAAENLDQVFERFVRLDSSRHRGGEETGSGLGLAICRQIVSLHGGAMGVESMPGKGSTFTVRLRRLDKLP